MSRRDAARDEHIARLKRELWEARTAILGLARTDLGALFTGYYSCRTRQEAYDWHYATIEQVVERTEPRPGLEMGDSKSSSDRAYCPLCGESSDNIYGIQGFAYPEGLRRHLEGSYNARKCDVTKAALGLALEHVDDASDPSAPKLGPVG